MGTLLDTPKGKHHGVEGLIHALFNAHFSDYCWQVHFHSVLLKKELFAPMSPRQLEGVVPSSAFKRALLALRKALRDCFNRGLGSSGSVDLAPPPISL